MVSLEEGISVKNLTALYADPFVSRIQDDGMEFAPVSHPLVTYLSAFAGNEFVGAYIIVRFSDFEYEAHSLLMKNATHHSRKLGELLIEWVFSHNKVMRLTGYIREGIQTAVNQCLKMGFKYEGFRRDALLVNGELKGIHILGLTRREWSSQ